MIINILITIIILGIIAYFCYINYKKCKNDLEKTLYILLFLASMVPIAIYYLDRYNVPTYLGWNINVNSQNWLAFLANYSAGIISSVISAVVLVIVTILQIKKNNEDNIERDKENLRVQNMPILKYLLDTDSKGKEEIEDLIITNIDNGKPYNLNISIKNIGLNSIKNIKVDFKSSLIKPTTDRILGNDSLEVLEQKEKIEINKYFYLIGLEKPYEITLIVYYEDVLTNWYRQVLNVHYTATNKLKEGEHIGIVKYEVDKEELIQAEDVNST